MCNSDILDETKKLGELINREQTEVDYKSKINPVISSCEYGRGFKYLYGPLAEFELIHTISVSSPTAVTVDKYGRIIVVCGVGGKRIYIF